MTKGIKRRLSVITTLIALVAIIICVVPQFAFASSQEDKYAKYFSGGDGNPDNPYLITSAIELNNIRHTFEYSNASSEKGSAKSFKLVNNITITDSSWLPIEGKFTGKINGNNKTIYNLKPLIPNANSSTVVNCGFLEENEGEIRDLNFASGVIEYNVGLSITANIGIIAGRNSGLISNCRVDNYNLTVNSNEANVGGLVGRSDYGIVSNCSISNSTIKSNSYNANVGGYVGYSNRVGIYNCENNATIIGSGNIGGITGYAYAAMFDNCKNRGEISYSFNLQNGCAAGIIGKAERSSYLEDCINYGNIVYSGDRKAGNSSIFPCMAQIIGWAVSAELVDCTISAGKTNYDKLYKGLFINQRVYCSDGDIGRQGNE